MSPLRQKMIDLMTVKQFSERTQNSYLYSMMSLVKYYRKSPDLLSQDDLQNYFIYLIKDRNLAANSCRLQVNAIRFFYRWVLGRSLESIRLHYPKRPLKIPELLTRDEARKIVNQPTNLMHQTMLKTCYGCGLRVSEVCALQVKDIDGERLLLKVNEGKGKKDRMVPLPKTVLMALRQYWYRYRPYLWLFYSKQLDKPFDLRTLQKVYKKTKAEAGVQKTGGIHGLRHAYATHQLEAGLPIHLLQNWLGHQNVNTTMRYIHWIPSYHPERDGLLDLLSEV